MTSPAASAERLDEATIAAIRQALASAQMGRLGDACATAEKALAAGGDSVALNAMLGMLRGRAGDPNGAIRHLEIAHRARSNDAHIAANLVTALMEANELDRAFAVARPELAFSDPTYRLARLRGFIAQMLGNPAAALEAYEHVVAGAPNDWEMLNNLGNARIASGELAGGIAALRRSAELNPEAAPTRLNLARALRRAGEFAEAEQILRRMADDFPEDAKPLIDLHDLLKQQARDDAEVLTVLERAIQRDPGNVELQLGIARQHGLLMDMDQAETAFRRAISLDPANSAAFLGLATVYEHRPPEDMANLVDEAERNSVEPAMLNLLRAFSHRRTKRYAEGLAALEHVPRDFEPVRREDLSGQFHDRLGNYDAAFAAFTRMNAAHAEDVSQPLRRAADQRQQIRERLERTTPSWVASWKTPPIDPDRPSPVFLVGFPRSGTTLLDTMLMGHPDVEVLEERPLISHAASSLGPFAGIPDVGEAEIRRAQDRYFEEASKYVEVRDGALLVDKSPLLLNGVPTIRRIFPNAQFILALRHPADSVLSCFISNFRPNPAMSNFMQLDTAAEFYDLTFSNWENSRAIFPIDVHTIVYEELVKDPEAELRRLSDWLGLRWHDDMLDHQTTAANRGLITTASYAQVTEPIYHRSVGRWRHYREHLEPIMPVLQPWIEKFGYTS